MYKQEFKREEHLMYINFTRKITTSFYVFAESNNM
jgi:hypothetical protein